MTKTIQVVENILSANDQIAEENRQLLEQANVFSLNIMASPGAGKTSIIEQLLKNLNSDYRIAVVEGDIATNIDATRAENAGAYAVQINTGGNCHLEAQMVKKALEAIPIDEFDVLIVENVGNLVCPSHWQLGTTKNVLIASIPEGDDKPYKYPGMYQGVDLLVINKIDLLPYVDFDMDYFIQGIKMLNPDVEIIPLSARTNEGFEDLINWLHKYLQT